MRDRTFSHEAFKARRKQQGLTQAALAERARVSVSYVKLLEGGPTQPSDPYVTVLAAVLGCHVNDLSTPKQDQDAA